MQKNILSILFLFAGIALLINLSACKKNQIITSSDAVLEFSVDTLTFDTVFTNMGSATKRFKIYNPHNQPIEVSNISLGGGEYSDYKINIDGANSYTAENIEIPPNDSIYIFVNVRIDPDNGDAIRKDSIMFSTNGNDQKVILQAYGWNAIYVGQIGYITSFPANSLVRLSAGKPYIFLGYIVVDSNSTMEVDPGVEIFMFGGPSTRPGGRALLYIGNNSTLKMNVGGDLNNPVEIKSHRLEYDYQLITLHHNGIFLSKNSVNNQIHGTVIRNAIDGIFVDSLSLNGNPKLEIKNSFIYNVDRAGIMGRQASIDAENLIIANSNQFDLITLRGGDYNFKHCTFANYGVDLVKRNEPLVSYRDYEVVYDTDGNETVVTADGSATFTNCIIYGSSGEETEVIRASETTSTSNVKFDYCLMKVDTFSGYEPTCVINAAPLFTDIDNYNFKVDTSASPAVDAGTAISVNADAEGTVRDGNPDIGAYELIK
ncbi:MAG: DUF5123 domain-containing protein [Aureispira sp.]|nr:DUF5123 domain-containing protein [Aureispira sp.]